MMRSSSEVQNYEVSRQISTRKMPSAKIQKITVAVLLREQMIVGPDGQSQVQTISAEEKQEIQALVTNALGLTPERGDMVIISSRPFMTKIVDGVVIEWYQEPWVRDLMNKSVMLLIIAVVSLGILRPLMTRSANAISRRFESDFCRSIIWQSSRLWICRTDNRLKI